MYFFKQYDLKKETTFGVEAKAFFFCRCATRDELLEAIDFAESQDIPFMIIGGGSNILFIEDYPGLVIKIDLRGIDVLSETQEEVFIKVQSGENWHEFVLYSLEQKFWGIENLSLIPGSVGAAPMQNIGAYGVEIKEVFYELEALDLLSKRVITLNKDECDFSYRYSVFKGPLKNRYVILSVTFRLHKKPKLNIAYGAIKDELKAMNAEQPTARDVSNAVVAIRKSKLPDPNIIGNAGSFFKNPIILKDAYEQIVSSFPECPSYEVDDKRVKVPAGFLIEKCGWKGHRDGDAGVHKDQALVLVNYGNASGKEIYLLSRAIQKSVKEKFNVELEREVNIVTSSDK